MKRQAGFSVIEVMVACSILVVIVMMLGMLFQQSSKAWRVGANSADNFMQVRAFVGALQRDASKAVSYQALKESYAGAKKPYWDKGKDSFGSDLQFYTLSGEVTNRAITFVEYSFTDLRRRETTWKVSSGGVSERSHSAILVPKQSNKPTPSFSNVKAEWDNESKGYGSSRQDYLPDFLRFKVKLRADSANMAEIGAASAGPDGRWNTSDDITTWSKD